MNNDNIYKLLHDVKKEPVKIDSNVQIMLWCRCYHAEIALNNDISYCIEGILRAITGQKVV